MRYEAIIRRTRPLGAVLALVLALAPWSHGQIPTTGPDIFATASTGLPAGARGVDLEGDGDMDIVYLQGGNIVAMINQGGGTFGAPVLTPAVSGLTLFFAFGEFDSDGLVDLVISSGSAVSIYFNNGGGSFNFGQSLAITSGLGRTVAVANINPSGVSGDGDLDFAVVETSGGVARVRLYANTGAGNFTFLGTTGSLSNFNGNQCHFADMDGDGIQDIVAVYQGGFATNDRLYVFYGTGFSTFTSSYFMDLTQTAYFNRIELKDVTGDNDIDVLSHSSTNVVVYENSGAGTIAATHLSPTGITTISGIDAADLDGDGDMDVVVTDTNSPYDLEYLIGDDSGVFNNNQTVALSGNPNPCCVDLEDFNQDGSPDALFTVLGGAASTLGILYFGSEPVNFRKVMITEVSWDNPDYVEITNFNTVSENLTGWTMKWKDGSTLTSSPLDITLVAGEPAVIGETGSTAQLAVPAPMQVVERLGFIGSTSGDLTVALIDDTGAVVDEVQVSSTTGAFTEGSLGGYFRGLATRTAGDVCVERIWGLDSNSGSDWTAQVERSPGFENRSSGPRGIDPIPVATILINETDDSPDLIELYNPGATDVSLSGWTLYCSATQNSVHTIVAPFTTSVTLAAGAYLVIGETPTPPAEMPAGTTYIDVIQNIPWATEEYDCVLYDAFGRVVDAMRTTGHDDNVVHNHPRAPTHYTDFRGAAGRQDGSGDDAIGRQSTTDTNMGGDFEPVFTRTMGAANGHFAAFNDGLSTDLDVRLNDHALNGGLVVLVNAGPAHAGEKFSYFPSLFHSSGQGPFIGLGFDALLNWQIFSPVPPFGAFLDAEGLHTIEFPPGILPLGFDMDIIAILQSGPGSFVTATAILEFDT